MAAPVKISVTTGDIDGIGTEIAAKALARLGPKANTLFYLWRSPRCPQKHLQIIDSRFRRITVTSWHEALAHKPSSAKELVDINSNLPPAKWVELSAQASLFGYINGLATAPLSKTSIREAGYSEIGHTEILMRVANRQDVFMTFVGKHFNVVIATGHIPIKNVPGALTQDQLFRSVLAAQKLKSVLSKKAARLPIAVVGLNPHAGEIGIIGNEELDVFKGVFEQAKEKKISLAGPLVPDAAFFSENWKKYSCYVCPYHDQALIPFKMIHGQESGVHITMGLPFVRTSVDHGTAKNIFGKNKANPASMYEAIIWATKLARGDT